MTEPGICEACGSDQVATIDSRRMPAEATYRRKACRNCGFRYSSTSRTFVSADGIKVTVEAPGTSRHVSAIRLERMWQRLRAALTS